MNNQMLSTFVISFLMLATPLAIAANTQGDNKGKPFQELQSAVDAAVAAEASARQDADEANEDAIEANSAAILAREAAGVAETAARQAADSAEQAARISADIQLQTGIDLNTRAIGDNTAALGAVAVELTDLNTRVDEVEVRVATNSVRIDEALLAISDSSEVLRTELRSALYDLELSIAQDVAGLRQELGALVGRVNLLTTMVSELTNNVTVVTIELRTAIESNSSEVRGLVANLTVMNAELSIAQSEIMALRGRVSDAEIALSNQTNSLAEINLELGTLDERVAMLEAGTTTPSSREFTFSETEGNLSTDDFSSAELAGALASLNFLEGDYLYVQGFGRNTTYPTIEYCTNDSSMKVVIDNFVSGGSYLRRSTNSPTSDTWGRNGQSWSVLTGWFETYSDNSGGEQKFSVRGLSSVYHGHVALFPRDPGSLSGTSNPDYEVYVQGWAYGAEQAITVKAGATRLEACGF
jgi:archaellum component FlaC